MIRISKGIATLWIIGIVIACLLIGLIIGCSITPGSIVRTEKVIGPCEHVNLNEVGLLEKSMTPHCDDCDSPAQKVLYDSNNKITYIYTYYYKYRDAYNHSLELNKIEILKIQPDGTSIIIER